MMGLVPDSGVTGVLPGLVGMARAKGLAMLGDKLPAETAEQWGMIWRCVDGRAEINRTARTFPAVSSTTMSSDGPL